MSVDIADAQRAGDFFLKKAASRSRHQSGTKPATTRPSGEA